MRLPAGIDIGFEAKDHLPRITMMWKTGGLNTNKLLMRLFIIYGVYLPYATGVE